VIVSEAVDMELCVLLSAIQVIEYLVYSAPRGQYHIQAWELLPLFWHFGGHGSRILTLFVGPLVSNIITNS
jgi:cellobiose-specific phosphotransferase system component IIC